ncbi:ferredoxin reductase-like protein [Aspergillus taichungensis]|uniref:NADH-cytochrome b5 reductase n=1 Tax=Aspergillus taichungensis TaxID=482145 RepID=A0A2J5HGD4_9EURO|nr:ferredoxin reductase-like protein [Aspergillus taichungensis]
MSLPRPVKIAGSLTITGLALYAITQARSKSATETDDPGVFSQWGPRSLRVRSVDTVNHNTKRLVFEFPDAQARSGLSLTSAVLTMCRPKDCWFPVIRPYTPISDLNTQGHLELMIKHYPHGKASSHMHTLKPGDTLTFLTSLPGFAWKPNQFPHVYLLAGGAGITPIYQLIRGIFDNPDDRTKVTLVFGVNTEEDLLLRGELEEYARRFPGRFRYLYTVSRPLWEGSEVRKGYVDEEVLGRVVERETMGRSKVFVCGPPAMERALLGSWGERGILDRLGWERGQVYRF